MESQRNAEDGHGKRVEPAASLSGRGAARSPNAERQVTRGRFEGLDAYRGIAALSLVVFHTYQYSREGTGADKYVYEGTVWDTLFKALDVTVWFFVLSGFLIFLPFARAAIKHGNPPAVLDFLIRRAIRIVPVYYAAIILVWTWRYSGSAGQWTDLLQHLTFTQVFSREHIFWTIGPSWALALIVQFYVFVAFAAPLAYWVCSQVAAPERRAVLLAGVVAALGVLSVAYKWWAFYIADIPKTDWPVYFGPLANLDAFAIGMLLAVIVAARQPNMNQLAPSTLMLTAAAIIVATIVGTESELVDLYFHTLLGLAFALLLAATVLAPRTSPWLHVLRLPLLHYLGLIWYGIFLWHEPILLELGKRGLLIDPAPKAFLQNVVILVLLSVAAGTLSYSLIERPVTNLRYLLTREGCLTRHLSEEDEPMTDPVTPPSGRTGPGR